MKTVSRNAATFVGLTSTVLWGAQPLLATYTSPFPPFETVAIFFGIGFGLMLIKWIWRSERILAHAHQPLLVWVTGVAGLFGYYALFYLALRYAPAIEVTLLANVWPLLFLALTALLPGEQLRWSHVLGCLIGFAGTVLLVGSRFGSLFDVSHLVGQAIALLGALLWSVYSVASRAIGKVPTDMVGWSCFASSMLALLCHFVLEPTVVVVPVSAWVSIVLIGVGPIGLALFAWDFGMKHGNMRLLGIASFFIPLISAVLLVVAGRAIFDWRLAGASVLITAGALLAAMVELTSAPRTQLSGSLDPAAF